jgi:hypothetical protein
MVRMSNEAIQDELISTAKQTRRNERRLAHLQADIQELGSRLAGVSDTAHAEHSAANAAIKEAVSPSEAHSADRKAEHAVNAAMKKRSVPR